MSQSEQSVNVMSMSEAEGLVGMFIEGTEHSLDAYQRSTAERVMVELGKGATILDFVEAAEVEDCLGEFIRDVDRVYLSGSYFSGESA